MTTRTTITVVCALAGVFSLGACTSAPLTYERAQLASTEQLEVGMSIAETRELLGDNFETRHEEHTRTWFYETDSEDEWNDVFVVRFDSDWKIRDWTWAAE